MMDYRIETKPDMLLTGFKRRFTGDPNEKQDQDHYKVLSAVRHPFSCLYKSALPMYLF